MHALYETGAYTLARPRAGTATAQKRPLTLVAHGPLTKSSLTDAQLAAWQAETDPEKRGAILDKAGRVPMKSGRVTLSTDQRAEFVAAIRGSVEGIDKLPKGEQERAFADAFRATLEGGVVIIDTSRAESDADDSEAQAAIIAELFAL